MKQEFTYKEIKLISDASQLVVTRSRTSEGGCSITIKFGEKSLVFSHADSYEEEVHRLIEMLTEILGYKCSLPGKEEV